jgi:predicted nucleotidyltransferase component of viral defense system
MSDYSRKEMGRLAVEHGFIRDTFEKVSRLVGLLAFFERDPALSKYLALKGGTAINLTIFSLPRLSVDIDLDFTENLPLEETTAVRETLRDTLDKYMAMNGYVFSADRSKQYHALDSSIYHYINAGGVKDNIKIEINYSLRCHVLPLTCRQIVTLGVFEPINVLSLDPIEIFAAKIVALLTRAAARDLYDVHNMVSHSLFNEGQWEMLRKCAVFYCALSAESVPIEMDFSKMDALTEREIRTRLVPMLRRKEPFNLSVARDAVRNYLIKLLALPDNEKQFLTSFRNGEYRPELLFAGDELKHIREHPMIAWKMRHLGQFGSV